MTTHDIYQPETPVQRAPLAPLAKHSQFIPAIDAEFFYHRGFQNGIQDYDLQKLYQEVAPYLSIRQRAALEKNTAYRQILPYKVIQQTIDGVRKIVAYRRLKTGGESRLYGLMSIGFGGHVDFEDIVTYAGGPGSQESSTIDLETTIRQSSAREIGEEVHFVTASGGAVPFQPHVQEVVPANLFIHYNRKAELGEKWKIEDDVHIVHVAFVYNIEADPRMTFVSGEPEQIEMLPPMTVEELLASGYEMEEWTRLLLEKMAADRAAIEASHTNLLA